MKCFSLNWGIFLQRLMLRFGWGGVITICCCFLCLEDPPLLFVMITIVTQSQPEHKCIFSASKFKRRTLALCVEAVDFLQKSNIPQLIQSQSSPKSMGINVADCRDLDLTRQGTCRTSLMQQLISYMCSMLVAGMVFSLFLHM